MIKPVLSIAGETITHDPVSNSVSIINLVEGIMAPRFPVLLPRLTIMFVLERTLQDQAKPPAELTVTLNGKKLGAVSVDVDFQNVTRTRAIVVLGGVVLPEPGTLRATLLLDSKKFATWTIETAIGQPAPTRPAVVTHR